MPPPEAIGSPGPELLWTKLAAPAPRPGLLPRTDLQEQLQKGLEAKLCLLDAPAGSGKTTLLELHGVGPIVAAYILGHVGNPARFATPERFASYNGTAPIEWSSGNPARPIHRLSRRGNRTLNHVIHIAAVTQLRHRHSPGRAYYDGKRTQGLTGRAALRSLKRRISDAIYRRLVADAARRS
jgi:transposase